MVPGAADRVAAVDGRATGRHRKEEEEEDGGRGVVIDYDCRKWRKLWRYVSKESEEDSLDNTF